MKHAAVAGLMVPSPIAESPNREAFETNAPPFAAPGSLPTTTTSPLAHQASGAGSDETGSSVPQAISASASGSDGGERGVTEGGERGERERGERETTESPTGYVPPPLLDSAVGNPGAFTDESDTLPQPAVIRDPYGGGVAGRSSRSRVDLSAVPPPMASTAEEAETKRDGEESLPNPHEQRETSLPNPHEGVGATRGLEGGPSVSAVSTEADYGVEVERARDGSPEKGAVFGEHLVESMGGSPVSPESNGHGHGEFGAAVEEHATLATRGKGVREEEEGYGAGYGTRDGKDGGGQEERGREPTLPAYSETGGQGWGDGYVDSPSSSPLASSSSGSLGFVPSSSLVSAHPSSSSFAFWPFSSLFSASSSSSSSSSSSAFSTSASTSTFPPSTSTSDPTRPTRSHPRPSHPSSSTTSATADGHTSPSPSSSSADGRLPRLDVNGGPLDVHGHPNGDAKVSPYPYTPEDAGVYTLFLYLFCIVLYLFYGVVYLRLNPGWY